MISHTKAPAEQCSAGAFGLILFDDRDDLLGELLVNRNAV